MMAKATTSKLSITQKVEQKPNIDQEQPRIYADEQELKEMKQCHPPSVKILEALFKKLPGLDNSRALEAACGDGRFTEDLLHNWFNKIDLFDLCPIAIGKVNALKDKVKAIDDVRVADMLSYQFHHTYSAIVLRWCVGYLNDQQLVSFLQRAKYWLKQGKRSSTRKRGFLAYIIVFDSVASNGRVYPLIKDQQVRPRTKLEELFKLAQLTVINKIKTHKLGEYEDVMAWALV